MPLTGIASNASMHFRSLWELLRHVGRSECVPRLGGSDNAISHCIGGWAGGVHVSFRVPAWENVNRRDLAISGSLRARRSAVKDESRRTEGGQRPRDHGHPKNLFVTSLAAPLCDDEGPAKRLRRAPRIRASVVVRSRERTPNSAMAVERTSVCGANGDTAGNLDVTITPPLTKRPAPDRARRPDAIFL